MNYHYEQYYKLDYFNIINEFNCYFFRSNKNINLNLYEYMEYQRNNILRQNYNNVNSMRSIQNNQLLRNISSVPQLQKRNPNDIREAILDQRKTDEKINVQKFNKIVSNMGKIYTDDERKKLWAQRTNQPYKNILPASEIKKEYKTSEELVVYHVKPEDKNIDVFNKSVVNINTIIADQNKGIQDRFSPNKLNENKQSFEYNHIGKFHVRYDPSNFNELKDDIVSFYKKEQHDMERDKKSVDDIIEGLITMDNDSTNNIPNETEIKVDKYASRQKKV